VLYGTHCTSCDATTGSSERKYCARCFEPTLERTTLGTTGTVQSFTVVQQQLPGSLMKVPYVIASIRLAGGGGVQTILTDIEPADVRVDISVEICLRQVTEDDSGNPVVSFFFRPADKD
jgi:uncharacterized OB-fold protein